ncbi:1-acylglycerol-3-phosphate O-acyltransferase Pnpla3-like [Ornithorhynchus anatinus]|uniref:1-acylglycerol-3-phosphate O-acyltransferase Pnpla3-like n=1 Tax=Ornithorhynchus anatinus TaxID=9258 RepID=UPI0019D4585A|nr:1-acylglycerol-3-phosphate O-acyltransferase Pnpla3-like [Ornithorhynchus anatinus]
MFDLERGWNFSFTGCGFLGFYHTGVLTCLNERAPHLLLGARKLYGASAGALSCAIHLCQIPLDVLCEILVDLVRRARYQNIGVLHPSFNLSRNLRKILDKHLPGNAHQLVSDKLCVSLTRVADGKNVLVSHFLSKQDVIDALICSSFIPIYCGWIPPSFRGERYVDGGISNNQPQGEDSATITVSPFYGECDICPRVPMSNLFCVTMANLSFRLCQENFYLLTRTLIPPEPQVVTELCHQGYLDTFHFLEDHGLLKPPAPCSCLPPIPSSAPPATGCGLEDHREADTLPALQHQTIVPRNERISDILSSGLFKALTWALAQQGGLQAQISRLLPVQILSCPLLPCTLPVESALWTVRRLIEWIPDIQEDIRWLLEEMNGAFWPQPRGFLAGTNRRSNGGRGRPTPPRTAPSAKTRVPLGASPDPAL